MIVAANPEFRTVTETEIEAALNDPDPANPIAIEVARLIEGYTANFVAEVERRGAIPASILRSKGSCTIEEIAMRLTTETIRQTVAPRTAGH